MRTAFPSAVARVFLAGSTGLLAAQAPTAQPRSIALPAASAMHPEEFTSVTSIRELSDGRVIATDGREQRLLLLDFANGSASEIGRKGGGPLEYAVVSFVYALGGDSSIMADFQNQRWLLFAGDRPVATVSPTDAAVKSAPFGVFNGADAFGRVLARAQAERRDGTVETGREDSTTVLLIDRATARVDTVARTLNLPRTLMQQRNAAGVITRSSAMPRVLLGAEETAILLTDGTLVVARVDPFRVDWRSPDGRWTRGQPLAVPRIRVDARERAAYAARQQPMNLPPGFQGPPPPDPGNFAEFVPPFPPGNAVMQGPGGTVIIRRTKSADFPGNHYFVVDRVRGLIGEIALPVERTIVGAGLNSIYLTTRDADDVLRLSRIDRPMGELIDARARPR
jgi:hypothetical protein